MVTKVNSYPLNPIPCAAGIGLRHIHFQDFLKNKPNIDWIELHSENFFCDGGIDHYYLERIRPDYLLSFHGVGLSLGTATGLDERHLLNLKKIFDIYQPTFISDHLSWSIYNGFYLNDLLPVPYTKESLDIVSSNINKAQDFFKKQLIIENPSSYIGFTHNDFSEHDFLKNLSFKTGCGLLIDVNNIYVSSYNIGISAKTYIDNLIGLDIKEIHLGGPETYTTEKGDVLVDTHGSDILNEVWDLYEYSLQKVGPKPTLIERDTNIPTLDILLEEVKKADQIIKSHREKKSYAVA